MPAVKIKGFFASKVIEKLRKFDKFQSVGVFSLPSVHNDKAIVARLIVTDRSTRIIGADFFGAD